MDILEIIGKKQNKEELTKQEIEYFVKEYTNGNIADYQAAALVMAIYINGMTIEETTNLTLAMAYSGDVLDLSKVGNVVDKHSTGGIGDKVTIILMPIVAAMGVKVAKMSGRGLGFTGGTKDKLEAIPGYRTEISIEEFINNVNKIGISLIGQTLNLAPADKKLYALRDSINCTANIPLISSSIMSKKIAAGANKIVLDVTCGSGAFMKNIKDAEELSKTMINIGQLANKETVCIITNMDQPLGRMVGNTLEIIEAIEALKGNMQQDIKNVVLELGAYILKLDGKGDNIEENKKAIEEVITNGKAYRKFLELVSNQGGDISYIENTDKFKKAKYKIPVVSEKSGFIKSLNAEEVGKIAMHLGAGRIKKEDNIDYSVGIELIKKVGDYIQEKETIAYIYANDEEKGINAKSKLFEIYKTSEERVEKTQDILEIMTM
jgi:pyrimidine-nucleoside phosphorylase